MLTRFTRPWSASSLRVLVRESFETIILALLVFMVLHVSIQNYKVEGPSMEPTLNQNEYLIVNKIVYLRFDPAEVFDALPFYGGETDEDDQYIFPPPVR
ncbi:MAG: S26 family signal peptidase, partial [Chloroflexi bacterium]|nr:S26 family signal peptidase [Chloroflexota bacterium]